MVARGITEDEFERARAFVVGGLVRSLEDSAVVAAWYAREQALEPTPLTPEALTGRIRAVTRHDVDTSARACLGRDWPLIAVAGPLGDAVEIPTELAFEGAG